MMEYEIAEPYAPAMIESLRAFGYDLPTAIADLIDNSVFAKAKNIWVDFIWDGENSSISITDDGFGISESELTKVMRAGSTNPLDERDPEDLGRFGLGLKTASFSQCRRLTVCSKNKNNQIAVRCWDLDYVNESGQWRLLKKPDVTPSQLRKLKELKHGTTVIWEKLDRLVKDDDVNNNSHKDIFNERIENVHKNLSMVFHRFLEDRNSLEIWLNNNSIEPWDPYLKNEIATQNLTEESLQIFKGSIKVLPYVLPHHSKITNETHEKAAGPRGWNAHQGFYVYRNRRLLVAGDWLGLGIRKDEHQKLARIQVDIPNNQDEEWNIDVKKSRAFPPSRFKNEFKRIAKLTIARATEIYRHRGKVIARKNAQEFAYVWEQKQKHGKLFYRLNRKHPLIKLLLEESGPKGQQIRALISLVEETLPTQLIMINNAEHPDSNGGPFEFSKTKELYEVAIAIIQSLVKFGLPYDSAINRLELTEPFNNYPEVIEQLRTSN